MFQFQHTIGTSFAGINPRSFPILTETTGKSNEKGNSRPMIF
ncbi:hypothetical protein HMPREF1545_03839 [Oscillibacter sp. KLE 1728]|nr:hypothetical protein HMPREF1545_03839 [Oscillibacter sp. KLE 1728]ERK63521.1 hypothetical protein HMPREF1546_02128 [Oscillibacter sp. KLE 1745]